MEPTLKANARTLIGKSTQRLRRAGILPAVLYGKGKTSLSLEVSKKEFEKVFRAAGENTLINLLVEGQERKVLVHDVAHHNLRDEAIHVDFYEVDLTRKIHAKVPVHLVGIAPAVKEQGGVLVKNVGEISVEALPGDLPQFIEVSIDGLKEFDNNIRVSDLKFSDKIKVLNHVEEVVVTVKAPRSEAELADLEKPAAEAEKAAIEGMTAQADKEKAEKTAESGEDEKGGGEKAPAAEAKVEKKVEKKPEKK